MPVLVLGICRTAKTHCVAERMRWASRRITTRSEDLAYCLLGIFGVHIPLLYGEGQVAAFYRLQEAIMQKTTDHSLLAWDSELPHPEPPLSERVTLTMRDMFPELSTSASDMRIRDFRPALALSPTPFSTGAELYTGASKSGAVYPSRMTNKGLEITLPVRRQRGSDELYYARLPCSHEDKAAIITLRLLGPFDNRFARVKAPLIYEPSTDFIRPRISSGPPFFASMRTLEDLPLVSYLLGFMMRSRWEQTTIFIVQELSASDYIAPPESDWRILSKVMSIADAVFGTQWAVKKEPLRESSHLESWEFATRKELLAFLLCSWLIMQGQNGESDGIAAPLVGLNLAFLPVWVLNHHMSETHAPSHKSKFTKINRTAWLAFKILGLGVCYTFLDLLVDKFLPTARSFIKLINLCVRPFAFVIWTPRPTRSVAINMISIMVRILGTVQLVCEIWKNRPQYQQVFAAGVEWVGKIDATLGTWTDPRHILFLQICCSTLVHQLQTDRQTRSGAWSPSVVVALTLTFLFAYPDFVHLGWSKIMPFG